MSFNVTINGVSYNIPNVGGNGWGQNVDNWIVAVSSGLLQKSGGLFTLTSELDFGASFGIKALTYKTRTTPLAATGQIRFGRTDAVVWRNDADSADLALAVNASNQLTFNGSVLALGTGDVSGPGAATDNALARFDSTTGKIIQNSGVIADDSNNVTGINNLTITGDFLQTSSFKADDLAIGFDFEGPSGGASTTTDVLAKVINQGAIINAASLSAADIDFTTFDAANKQFGSYSLLLGSGRILAYPAKACNRALGSFTAWFRNLAVNDYIAYNPLLGIELFLNASGFLTAKVTEKVASTESAKMTATVTGAVSRASDSAFKNVTMKWRLNDEAGASTDLLGLQYQGADEGSQLTGQDLDINAGDGGVWFFGVKRNDPTWDHFYAANGLPTAHSDAWTKTGTFTESASAGVLTVSLSGLTGNQYYSKTNNIDLDGMTVEWKMKGNNVFQRAEILEDKLFVMVRDDSKNRGWAVGYSRDSVYIVWTASGTMGGGNLRREFFLDVGQYHVYRVTSVISGADCLIKFYIDGVLVYSETNNLSETTAGDIIQIGSTNSSSTTMGYNLEYFKYESNGSTTVYPPIVGDAQGNLDDIAVTKTVISNQLIAALQTNSIKSIFGALPNYGPTLPIQNIGMRSSGPAAISATTYTAIEGSGQYIAGDGVTRFMMSYANTALISAGSSTARIAIDVLGDFNGLAPATAGSAPYPGVSLFLQASGSDTRAFLCQRQMILPIGLNPCTPVATIAASTLTLNSQEGRFTVGIDKYERIA